MIDMVSGHGGQIQVRARAGGGGAPPPPPGERG